MTEPTVCGWRGCQRVDVHQHYEPIGSETGGGTGGGGTACGKQGKEMTEPTERDREMVQDAVAKARVRRMASDYVGLWNEYEEEELMIAIAAAREEGRQQMAAWWKAGYEEFSKGPIGSRLINDAVENAREEGRREERARCAAIARSPLFTCDHPDWGFWEAPEIAPAIAFHIEHTTVSDLSDETQGVPSPKPPKNDQG